MRSLVSRSAARQGKMFRKESPAVDSSLRREELNELCVLLPTLVADAYTCLPHIKSDPPASWYGASKSPGLKMLIRRSFYEKAFCNNCIGDF